MKLHNHNQQYQETIKPFCRFFACFKSKSLFNLAYVFHTWFVHGLVRLRLDSIWFDAAVFRFSDVRP